RVVLLDGENTFRAIGFSTDRTESNPDEVTVKLNAPAKLASLNVFVVGINKYKNPGLNLSCAEQDGMAIREFFTGNGKSLFKDVNITEICNESATKDNILDGLDGLQTQPQDVAVIYLAGHGVNLKEDWYFIPCDVVYPEKDEEVRSKGISGRELVNKIRNINALKKLVLIDACKSGGVLLASERGVEERRVMAQLARATGIHIIAAAGQEQSASELKELGHGAFTYVLLEGLNGKAKKDGNKITVRGLLSYVEEKLPEITRKYRTEAQYPVSDSRGMDFPIVIAK
ncbi:MAG: caspase family protein, partial [Planctomycetota bacterium]